MLNSFIPDNKGLIPIYVLLRCTEVLFLVLASTVRKQLGQDVKTGLSNTKAHVLPPPCCLSMYMNSMFILSLALLLIFRKRLEQVVFSKVPSTFSSAFEYQRVPSPVAQSQD